MASSEPRRVVQAPTVQAPGVEATRGQATVVERLLKAWPLAEWSDSTVLVAVSGGADSIALLRALDAACPKSAAGRLCVAHFNHKLRSAESDADAEFVSQLADQLQLPLSLGSPAPAARTAANYPNTLPCPEAENGRTPAASASEESLRGERYAWLTATAERLGARYVVTGHTSDDQAETILHRIVRGTGLAGLAGMPAARLLSPAVSLVRPLLDVGRDELRTWLAELGQEYRSDRSNRDTRYTRNRIRHEVMPQLANNFNPQVAEALVRLGRQAGEASDALRPAVQQAIERCTTVGLGQASIDCAAISEVHRYVQAEMFGELWRRLNWPLRAMGAREWDRLVELTTGRAGCICLPGNVEARRTGDVLTLRRLE